MRNLDAIYGALYDMLNQNYTIVNGRRNCRIALGAESNPMCFVHDTFRCIVVVEKAQVASPSTNCVALMSHGHHFPSQPHENLQSFM